MRERGAWGEGGAPGARWARPDRARLGQARSGRRSKPAVHTTTDQKPITKRDSSEAKRTCD